MNRDESSLAGGTSDRKSNWTLCTTPRASDAAEQVPGISVASEHGQGAE